MLFTFALPLRVRLRRDEEADFFGEGGTFGVEGTRLTTERFLESLMGFSGDFLIVGGMMGLASP